MFNKEEFIKSMEIILRAEKAKTLDEAEEQERWNALSKTIIHMITPRWKETTENYHRSKQAYYFSAEFLMGRALSNNLMNLGIDDKVRKSLRELNIDLNKLERIEEDAGLGNGGLGRLAACFMDSSATLNLPVTGYGIRYRYGIFKQRFEEGFQVEEGDNWMRYGDPWSIRREEESVMVSFHGQQVKAIPYDTPIIGYQTKSINTLRLWQAEATEEFNYPLFNQQQYDEAVRKKNRAEDISKVLYPNDSNTEGKKLRLKQQYFFVSASLQDLVSKYREKFGENFEHFSRDHAIQLNDTHPVVAIPELMRILLDELHMPWKKAWKIVVETFSYTNHTTLAEALEKWDIGLFSQILPRIYEIVVEIHRRFEEELISLGYSQEGVQPMRIICHGQIHMAWLAIVGSHTVNGVAQIHTEILKNRELRHWYKLYPQKFQNKTNGITPRRWLALCNRELASLITELLGDEGWIVDLKRIKKLEKYAQDPRVLKRFLEIKQWKKKQLAEYIEKREGIVLDTQSIFDIQIKRLHEYKRQLLKAFHILDLYFQLKENPEKEIPPITFIFGAKAAPGYYIAKGIIKYMNEIAKLINGDEEIEGKLKVVFVENYNVSYGEYLFPGADLSEQISTAGKEASGTGNMKFMLNGAPTLGTYDGANVEIIQEAGKENNYIFGATVEELEILGHHYNPKEYYKTVPGLKRVMDTLIDGTFDDGGTGMFQEIYKSLLEGAHWQIADQYFILKDFEDYRQVYQRVLEEYQDRILWAKKCWMNICNAGKFSSDRTVQEYAKEIWHIKKQN
ncbi:glycogen/starch/alpha-glucan phosphorylase [Irregularibacter muris]|uniref:Alpha-1,4 glucan phosphorylase n=1 Tax=Irregularibacter muris TaxID=1796619 RepID=A0AAE3HH36_9FIRM|nr:glycogen/starch/alpha-glucan phosphorylase [Irregularibacter muris]MCR1898969.1 glycogen/starch/alpha-glucan phosphorylase [Irregularibacter muris]